MGNYPDEREVKVGLFIVCTAVIICLALLYLANEKGFLPGIIYLHFHHNRVTDLPKVCRLNFQDLLSVKFRNWN